MISLLEAYVVLVSFFGTETIVGKCLVEADLSYDVACVVQGKGGSGYVHPTEGIFFVTFDNKITPLVAKGEIK